MAMLATTKAQAQTTEWNVKVRKGSPSERFLSTLDHSPQTASPSALRTSPQWQGITHAQALSKSVKRPAPALERIYTLRFQGKTASDLSQILQSNTDFEWMEPNHVRPLHLPTSAPNDARISEQWYHDYVGTFTAWDSTQGKSDIVVGVLDTGLDFLHPELSGQMAIKASEDLNGNGRFDAWPDTVQFGGIFGDLDGLDQDGNGYADDVSGYDFTDQPRSPFGGDFLGPDPLPFDDNNHGTLVGGIIAARADNQLGGAGIAPGCRLMALRAFSANGSGEDDDVARAILYAADNGVQILNFSFGDIYPSRTMQAAVEYAASKGVVMIASAGNGTGDSPHYPSGFDAVISVGASAVTSTGEEILWPLSSFGHTLSLVAPGSGILCPTVLDTLPVEEAFDFFSGTSCAAPMVSAAVALLFSQRGVCPPKLVRGLLTSTADDISSPGWDHYTGAGRLNIPSLLQQRAASHLQILHPSNDSGTSSDSIIVVVTALDAQGTSIRLQYQSGVQGTGPWSDVFPGTPNQIANDTLAVWHVGSLVDGEYTLRLILDKSDGSTLEDRKRIVIDRTAPVTDVKISAPVWDNASRAHLVVYRNSDRCQTRIHVTKTGGGGNQTWTFDRNTRNGYFLLNDDMLEDGTYSWYLESRNEAGLSATTPLDTFSFQASSIDIEGYALTGSSLPMGHYLQTPVDLDGDGLKEVVMSRYDEALNFGKVMSFEYNAVAFTAVDSLNFKPVLIPKYLGDVNSNGLLELLCSVNDSIFLLEQVAPTGLPNGVRYRNEGNGLYPATFADSDNDNELELLVKDQTNYRVFEPSGSGYAQQAILVDPTGGFLGSVAPLVVAEDLDADGKTDLLMGDYDGDLQIHEFNGSQYTATWTDTTQFEHAADYLASGDFNGNGKPEFFVAVHSTLNRNEQDFEYEAPVWWLRIFESNADDVFEVVWEDYLFDVDTDDYNAATSANLDLDSADELIFATFPRTYIIDHQNSGYRMEWFHYGAIGTHHIAGDFNQDGIQEFTLGRGDTAFFVQKDLTSNGPDAIIELQGAVTGNQSTHLEWPTVPNAVRYRIWRGDYNGPGTVQISILDSTNNNRFDDTGLTAGQTYLYVVESCNPSLPLVYSPFSNAVFLTPKNLGGLDSAWAVGPNQVMLRFDVAVQTTENELNRFGLDSSQVRPVAAVSGVDGSKTLLLTFENPFSANNHTIRIDSGFKDADDALLDSARRAAVFSAIPDNQSFAYFTNWRVLSSQSAEIRFSHPMTSDVLIPQNWTLFPSGKVVSVEFVQGQNKLIKLTLDGCALGSLGNPVSLTLLTGSAIDGAQINPKSGNTATFSSHESDLSSAYVYPNPFRSNDVWEGVRFANLTRTATVHVLTVSGQEVFTLEETDGDGGVDWNLLDFRGERVVPGVYLFRVESAGSEPFLGKFSILE
jgi:hypothetical protein